jgi:hypothetical protein
MEGGGDGRLDPDSEAGKKIVARDIGTVKKFVTVHTAVCAEGMLTERSLRQCCEGLGRFPVGYHELMRLRTALDVVAKHMTKSEG